MKILIVSPGVYTCGIFDEPLVGRYYILEPAGEGTGEQNRAFHALVQEYFSSGCHSYPAASYEDLRNCIKKSLGAGFEKYIYITSNERGISKGVCKSRSEVPADVAVDAEGNRMLYGVLKSWHDYTKKERTETIDRLIAEMHQAGVQTKKFHEILAGMEDNGDKA